MRGSLEQRFWQKVIKGRDDECWIWTAAIRPDGYGVIGRGGRGEGLVRAHRASYELVVGPIPNGLQIDHLCRNRRCVNPAHLEPVTQKTNIMRGNSLPARNARKTHCSNGHEFSIENTYRRGEWRACIICRDARNRGIDPSEAIS